MWLLLLRGASVISVSADAFWSADGPDLHLIGWGDACSGFKFNPHRCTGPEDPRDTRALFLRGGLERLESVEDYLLPRFIDGNPISKYVTLRFRLYNLYMAT